MEERRLELRMRFCSSQEHILPPINVSVKAAVTSPTISYFRKPRGHIPIVLLSKVRINRPHLQIRHRGNGECVTRPNSWTETMSPRNKTRVPTNTPLPLRPLHTLPKRFPFPPGKDTFTRQSARRTGAPPRGPRASRISSCGPFPPRQARSTGGGGGPRSQAPGGRSARPPRGATPTGRHPRHLRRALRTPGNPWDLPSRAAPPPRRRPLLGLRPAAAARAPETCSNRCSPTSCSAHSAWSRCPLPASAATSPAALRPGFPGAHVTRAVPVACWEL